MQRRLGTPVVCARWVLASLLAASAAHASPQLGLQFGRGFAVASEINGAFDQGGPHVAASLMWPWEERFRFGITAFGTDLGNVVERIFVTDPGSGTTLDLGSIELAHLDGWGVAWRVDAVGKTLGFVQPSVSVSYGYIRLEADRVGTVLGAASGVMWSAVVGVERQLSARHAVALTGGGTWLTDEAIRHYGTAALEWRWLLRAPAPAVRP